MNDNLETARTVHGAAVERHRKLSAAARAAAQKAAEALAARQGILDAAGRGEPVTAADVRRADDAAGEAARAAELALAVEASGKLGADRDQVALHQAEAREIERAYAAATAELAAAGADVVGRLADARAALERLHRADYAAHHAADRGRVLNYSAVPGDAQTNGVLAAMPASERPRANVPTPGAPAFRDIRVELVRPCGDGTFFAIEPTKLGLTPAGQH